MHGLGSVFQGTTTFNFYSYVFKSFPLLRVLCMFFKRFSSIVDFFMDNYLVAMLPKIPYKAFIWLPGKVYES